MAFQVKLYQFYKKVNSTKQPTDSDSHVTLDVELKDASNIISPTIILSGNFSGNVSPHIYRYCHIPQFSRYYFVKSWSWLLGRWECDLEVDLLATFKTSIGNTHAYVLRSASDYNPDILDTKYPTKRTHNIVSVKKTADSDAAYSLNIYGEDISNGFYAVAIANHDSSAIGGVSYYAFSASAMRAFQRALFDSPSWMNVTDASISNDLQKMLLDPIQYITSVMWIPYGFPFVGNGLTSIPFGWWTIPLPSGGVHRLSTNTLVLDKSFKFNAVNHPQYDRYKRRWLNLSPYRQIALNFEPFGMFQLDSSKIEDNAVVRCYLRIDVITGLATLRVYTISTNELLYTTSAQLGVPMSIAQMSVDVGRISSMSTWVSGAALAAASDDGLQESISSSVQAVSEAVKSGGGGLRRFWKYLTDSEYRRSYSPEVRQAENQAVSNAVGSVIGTVKQSIPSIGNAAIAISGVCESKGNSGSIVGLTFEPTLIFYFQEIVDTDDAYYGIPLCRNVQLGNLRGFILCANSGDFVGAYSTEIEEQGVRALLESGFFYE